MFYQLIADALLVFHLLFLGFVFLGWSLVLRWPRLGFVHVPAVLWGALVELMGWICPLTPWEVNLRILAGQEGYAGSFIDQYLMPIIYPAGLTREIQIALAVAVVLVNGATRMVTSR